MADNQPKALFTCLTKAVVGEGDQLRTGPKWMLARRARLMVFEDHLQCGDWKIPYQEIQAAELASFRSPLLRIPGYVLSVLTEQETYHFGLNGKKFWKGTLPFSVERRRSKLRMSRISILARSILISYGIYLLWQWLAK